MTDPTNAEGGGSGDAAAKVEGNISNEVAKGSGTPTTAQAEGGSPPPTPILVLGQAVPIAVNIGWSMAVLFGYLPPETHTAEIHLPTEHELVEENRVALELVRVECLLKRLPALIPTNDHPIPSDVEALSDAWKLAPDEGTCAQKLAERKKNLRAKLVKYNLDLLKAFACASHQLELAYQMGRSLRDTASPPIEGNDRNATAKLNAITRQLSRRRITKLQEWLVTLAPSLPPNSGTVVAASLGKWSDFAVTVFDGTAPGSLRHRRENQKTDVASSMTGSLLNQGDVWLNLLTGVDVTTSLLTPEAFVAAGEAALSRTAKIVKRLLLHYWFALFVLIVATGGLIYVSARYLGGAAKVWTQLATVAGALGVTAKGIGTGVARLSADAERPIYQLEKLDAMAWAVTTLPQVKLNNRGVRALRRSGIERSGSLGR